jgi:hypothetical protein
MLRREGSLIVSFRIIDRNPAAGVNSGQRRNVLISMLFEVVEEEDAQGNRINTILAVDIEFGITVQGR